MHRAIALRRGSLEDRSFSTDLMRRESRGGGEGSRRTQQGPITSRCSQLILRERGSMFQLSNASLALASMAELFEVRHSIREHMEDVIEGSRPQSSVSHWEPVPLRA